MLVSSSVFCFSVFKVLRCLSCGSTVALLSELLLADLISDLQRKSEDNKELNEKKRKVWLPYCSRIIVVLHAHEHAKNCL